MPLAVTPPSWTAATPYPTNIFRYAFAQNGEDFYVISGAGINPVNTVRRYNATTNVWTSLANIPAGSQAPAGAFYGGKIYVADGQNTDFHIYDVSTNSWSAGPPRPGVTQSFGAAAGAYNGKVYVVAGGFPPSSVLSIYDIATAGWSAGTDSPSPFQLGGYVQIGQFLYLIGSFTNNFTNSTVSMRLDMATNTWSTGPVWGPQRADFALAAAGARLFAIGGDSNGGDFVNPSAEVHELDTSTWPAGTWIPSPANLPAPRQANRAGFFSTGRAGGEIWSTGGFAPGPSPVNEHLFRPVSVPCQDYNITQSPRTLAPAGTNIGNNCDDCVTAITLPFPVTFYGTTYTSANVSSNGNLQFNSASGAFPGDPPLTGNLPTEGVLNATIFPFWDDFRTDVVAGTGIFTSVTGSITPNRSFTIEWRVSQFGNDAATSNFAIRFFENSPNFEVIYGATTGTFTGTIGVQRDSATLFTQFAGPSANVPASGTGLLFTTGCCAPIAFNGAIGSGSITYPGASGTQTGRVTRDGLPPSECGTAKVFPGITAAGTILYDQYSFTNNGPATCVTFSINTPCLLGAGDQIFAVAYLGSYDPANLALNYLGDSGNSPNPFATLSVDVPANATVVLVMNEVTSGGTACPSYDVVVTGLSCPLELTTAVSRKRHGAAGEFNIPLPLTGPQAGVECRDVGDGDRFVLTFNSEVASGTATVTQGVGSAEPPSFLGRTMTVPLTGASDIQQVTLTLSGVTNSVGQVLPDTAVSMIILLGDTIGNMAVNASDIGATKAQSGLPSNAANFRADVTVSGSVNASDIGQVKASSGHFVP